MNQARKRQRGRRNNRSKMPTSVQGMKQPANAPVSSGFSRQRRAKPSGVFAPVKFYTSDLIAVQALGTVASEVVFSHQLAPQTLPVHTRGRRMASMFAKYRCLSATYRIQSAVPTSAGGQYAAFFDPNPRNTWVSANAIGALTSMPVQDVAAAWECLKLAIPAAELEREVELYTSSQGDEKLVTRVGQLVLLNLAVSNTTPPGTAAVSVWLDAEWEFYEPNSSLPSDQEPGTLVWPAGNWTCGVGGLLAYPTPVTSGTIRLHTVYAMDEPLPGSMFATGTDAEWVATSADTNFFAFGTEAEAVQYAIAGGSVGKLQPSGGPTSPLGVEYGVPIFSTT